MITFDEVLMISGKLIELQKKKSLIHTFQFYLCLLAISFSSGNKISEEYSVIDDFYFLRLTNLQILPFPVR